MRALSWIGYILLATVVLGVGATVVALATVGVFIVGALISVAAVVGITARLIKGLVES